MGQDEENSEDDEEEEDWTDDQMFAVDAAIGAAFKSQGRAARDEKAKVDLQRRNFKLRVLDVVEIYLQRNGSSPDQLLFIKPLLKCSKVSWPGLNFCSMFRSELRRPFQQKPVVFCPK